MKEIWKSIKGYDGLYEVSNFGRVKSLAVKRYRPTQSIYLTFPERILKGCRSSKQIVYILYDKAGVPMAHKGSRLVAKAFKPNPNNYKYVCHIDGNPFNNNIKNLQWSNDCMGGIKAISVRCIETGKIYKSIAEAAMSVNRDSTSLIYCLKGIQRTCAGYHWEYVDKL